MPGSRLHGYGLPTGAFQYLDVPKSGTLCDRRYTEAYI